MTDGLFLYTLHIITVGLWNEVHLQLSHACAVLHGYSHTNFRAAVFITRYCRVTATKLRKYTWVDPKFSGLVPPSAQQLC